MNISEMSDISRHRMNVSWNSDVSPSFKNCFGYCSRLSGHRRVPEPPARIMDLMGVQLLFEKILLRIYISIIWILQVTIYDYLIQLRIY